MIKVFPVDKKKLSIIPPYWNTRLPDNSPLGFPWVSLFMVELLVQKYMNVYPKGNIGHIYKVI